MKVAEALTAPSVTVLPAGVLKTTVAAVAGETVSTERHKNSGANRARHEAKQSSR